MRTEPGDDHADDADPLLHPDDRGDRARGRSALGIFLVNFFLGWTIIGWWVALIWAFTGAREVRYVPVYR